jgi:hypothetical protein
MGHEHERPVGVFSDLHIEHGTVKATLLHDPSVEGLDMAIYLDGSGSMSEEYTYKLPEPKKEHEDEDHHEDEKTEEHSAPKLGFFARLFGWFKAEDHHEEKHEDEDHHEETEKHEDEDHTPSPADAMIVFGVLTNEVEPQVRWMLEYLASKDRNGLLRVAYWACGVNGNDVEVLGDLKGSEAKTYKFPGPKQMGAGTVLTPALKDFVAYIKAEAAKGARQGCAVFVTDGQIQDTTAVKKYSAEVAKEILAGRLPRLNFILVGVGDAVNEEQMEEISHAEYPGLGHLWCHRVAREIRKVAELVAVLVDETMTVAAGGTIYDDKGTIVKVYEGRLPAVLEFSVPEGAKSFTLEVNGQRYTQPLPEGNDNDHH